MSRSRRVVPVTLQTISELKSRLQELIPRRPPTGRKHETLVPSSGIVYLFDDLSDDGLPATQTNPLGWVSQNRLRIMMREPMASAMQEFVEELMNAMMDARHSLRSVPISCKRNVFAGEPTYFDASLPRQFMTTTEIPQVPRPCRILAVPRTLVFNQHNGLFLRWVTLEVAFDSHQIDPILLVESSPLTYLRVTESREMESNSLRVTRLSPRIRPDAVEKLLRELPEDCSVCYEEGREGLILPIKQGETNSSGCCRAQTTVCIDCVARAFLAQVNSGLPPTCSFCRRPISSYTFQVLVKIGFIEDTHARLTNTQNTSLL